MIGHAIIRSRTTTRCLMTSSCTERQLAPRSVTTSVNHSTRLWSCTRGAGFAALLGQQSHDILALPRLVAILRRLLPERRASDEAIDVGCPLKHFRSDTGRAQGLGDLEHFGHPAIGLGR